MYREQVVLAHGLILEVMFAGEARWNLSLRKGKKVLVAYGSASGYELRSVEKLRYDFETDVENALRKNR